MWQHAMAVVDDEFEAHGLDGLRVIDASVMPAVTSTNTNAPTIIIAEKVPRSSRMPHGKNWWRRTRRRAGRCRRLVEREDVALRRSCLLSSRNRAGSSRSAVVGPPPSPPGGPLGRSACAT